MFYVYTIVIPVILFMVLCLFVKPNLKTVLGWTKAIWKYLPLYVGYTVAVYFVEKDRWIDSGWTFYTLCFFLIILVVINLIATIVLRFSSGRGNSKL